MGSSYESIRCHECGSNETLAANANEKITLVLEDISCKQAIQLLKDFAEGAAGEEVVKE